MAKNNEYALSFNQNYISTGITDLNTSNGFTIITYFKADSYGTLDRFVCKDVDGVKGTFNLYQYSGNIIFRVHDTNDNVGEVAFTRPAVGELHSFAATWNPETTEIKIYLDGILQGSSVTNFTSLKSISDPIAIGVDSALNSQYCFGTIDEPKMFLRTMSEEEINVYLNKKINKNEKDLLFYYPMDEGTGTITQEIVSNTAHNINGAIWVTGQVDLSHPHIFQRGTNYYKINENGRLIDLGTTITIDDIYNGNLDWELIQQNPTLKLEDEGDGVYSCSLELINNLENANISGGLYTNNLIPVMTSNTTPEGTVFYTSEYNSNNAAYHIFDNDLSTNWASSSGLPQEIGYEFTSSKKITKYEMIPRNSTSIDQSPKDWSFRGWNGSQWIILDTRTNITDWSEGVSKSFSFDNNESYQKYKLVVTSNNGGSYVGLIELKMMEYFSKVLVRNISSGQIQYWNGTSLENCTENYESYGMTDLSFLSSLSQENINNLEIISNTSMSIDIIGWLKPIQQGDEILTWSPTETTVTQTLTIDPIQIITAYNDMDYTNRTTSNILLTATGTPQFLFSPDSGANWYYYTDFWYVVPSLAGLINGGNATQTQIQDAEIYGMTDITALTTEIDDLVALGEQNTLKLMILLRGNDNIDSLEILDFNGESIYFENFSYNDTFIDSSPNQNHGVLSGVQRIPAEIDLEGNIGIRLLEPTDITYNRMTLNGEIYYTDFDSNEVWFNYSTDNTVDSEGKLVNVEGTTVIQNFADVTSFNQVIDDLNMNTTYYFEVMGKGI